MLSPLWQAEWQTSVVRRCRKGKEFVSRNMFTSRYVIACGLSEFMTNYHRLTGAILYRYIAFAAAAPQKIAVTFMHYDRKDSIVKTSRLL